MIKNVYIPQIKPETLNKMEELCCCAPIKHLSVENTSKIVPEKIVDILAEEPLITYKKIGNIWERVGESSYKMEYKK